MNLNYRLSLILLVVALASGCTALVIGGAAAGGYTVGKDERSVGTIIDDGTITASVKTRLIRSEYVKAGQVDVDTHEGVVTLNGTVDTYIAREQAERLAAEAKGVVSVVNKLEVEPATAQ